MERNGVYIIVVVSLRATNDFWMSVTHYFFFLFVVVFFSLWVSALEPAGLPEG